MHSLIWSKIDKNKCHYRKYIGWMEWLLRFSSVGQFPCLYFFSHCNARYKATCMYNTKLKASPQQNVIQVLSFPHMILNRLACVFVFPMLLNKIPFQIQFRESCHQNVTVDLLTFFLRNARNFHLTVLDIYDDEISESIYGFWLVAMYKS